MGVAAAHLHRRAAEGQGRQQPDHRRDPRHRLAGADPGAHRRASTTPSPRTGSRWRTGARPSSPPTPASRPPPSLFQALPKIDAIWNHDDDQGIGVLAAVNQANRKEFFMVGGAGSKTAIEDDPGRQQRAQGDRDLQPVDGLVGDLAGPPDRPGQGHVRPGGAAGAQGDHARLRDDHQGEREQATSSSGSDTRGRPILSRITATLRVGMVGYAFMGAAHSQAWRTVNRVYDLPVAARMSVICGRDAAKVAEAADRLGWDEHTTDWRALVAAGRHRPDRHLHPRRQPRRDRDRRARRRQACALRETAGQHRGGGPGDGRRRGRRRSRPGSGRCAASTTAGCPRSP